ncbi:penta-EF hand family protein [Paracoccus beibuensis]|uniref:hypothetical protein n=1 Tax=Paracoccus beibuensis TaxID=547602 RepID=UPI0022408D43|nr:hypothetical protein [Paracoccus beibuensis]
MTDQITKLTGLAAILAALSTTPALSQTMDAGWDADMDGALSQDEFATGLGDRGIFGGWDTDTDSMLSQDEFDDGVYGTYDTDASGDLNEAEYGMTDGAAGFWNRDETVDHQAWDVDGDGVILANEFADGWGETGRFGEFDSDADGSLTEDEFTTGIFGEYDADGTGVIEEPELTDVGDDMGDEGFWDV